VSHEELSSGVQLDLVHFGDWDDEPLVIAWTEAGEPDLDYDGLEARPPASVRLARVDALPTYSCACARAFRPPSHPSRDAGVGRAGDRA
jgi:hypothetical protein